MLLTVGAPHAEPGQGLSSATSESGELGKNLDQPVSDQAVSDQAVSDKAVSDQAASDQAVSDQPISDKAVSDQAVSDQTVSTPGKEPSPPSMASSKKLAQADFMAALASALERPAGSSDFAAKRDRAALVEFYGKRDHAPVWIADGKFNARARNAALFLNQAETYGLNSKFYQIPPLSLGDGESAPADALASAEIALSGALLAYARHAQAGRVVPNILSDHLTHSPKKPDPIAVMAGAATTEDMSAFLAGFNPPGADFEALRAKLAELRLMADKGGWRTISPGKTIKPGIHDPRVAELKQRFGIPIPPPLFADPRQVDHYTGAVLDALKAFQEEHGLEPDGIVGPSTLAALNMSVYDRAAQIAANMERWRWMPRNLGRMHVMVDVPAYEVRVVRNRKNIYSGRVIVGTEENPTPIFSDKFEYFEVNPYWNVPESIAVNEIIPAVVSDPGYLLRSNLEVLNAWGLGGEQQIDPRSVNWTGMPEENLPIRFRQPPGESNVLGSIKFMFPNKHSVYLHDTQTHSLFTKTKRTFSHGCVRLHQPMAFARALLSEEPGWSVARIKREIAKGGNRSFPLKRSIPVHLTYFTAKLNGAGKLVLRDDVYGHDRSVAMALGWY